jgi:hypothetical protein
MFDVIEDGHVKLNEHVINSSTYPRYTNGTIILNFSKFSPRKAKLLQLIVAPFPCKDTPMVNITISRLLNHILRIQISIWVFYKKDHGQGNNKKTF